MLVGYSSSSEDDSEAAIDLNKSCSSKFQEEDDGNDGSPVRKKPKTEEEVTKTRCV